DPLKLAARNMTPTDVANAIRSQNLDAPAGRIGQPPIRGGQAFEMPIDTLGRLTDPEQFGDIILKVDQGRVVPATTRATAQSRPPGSRLANPLTGLPPAIGGSAAPAMSAGDSTGNAGAQTNSAANNTGNTDTSGGAPANN